MANKRQRKKQQAKENIKKLQAVGVKSNKVIKEIKNDPKAVQQIYKKESRRIKANERSSLIKSLGYKVSEHGAKRYWSDARFNEWYAAEIKKKEQKEKRSARKKKDDDDLYLLIFWRDKTAEGYADTEMVERYKYNYKHLPDEVLIKSILMYLRTQKPIGAELGTSKIVVTRGSQVQQVMSMHTLESFNSNSLLSINEWVPVYKGKARRYHDLLLAIHAVVRLMYDNGERADFIKDLILKFLPMVNKPMAKRLANDLEWRYF